MKTTSPMMKAIRRQQRSRATRTFLAEIIVPLFTLCAALNFLLYAALCNTAGK